MNMRSELNYENEININSVLRDTSTVGQRIERFLRKTENSLITAFSIGSLTVFFPAISEIALISALSVLWYSRSLRKKRGLPMRMPMSSNLIDPKEIDLGTKRPTPAKGIVFIGNDKNTNEEIWLTDTQARTHMMFLGTTGSGKTEFLISVAFNAFVHGSGFIYVDGKADNSLYGKIYSMARMMGREDDVLLINFQTGAKDVFGAQPKKLSNTLNPFAVGSSGMLSQLVVGLMSGGKDGKQDVWSERAISFVEALLKPLVYLRDYYGLLLDVEVIRNYFNLEPLVALVTENMHQVKNDFDAKEWKEREDAKYPGLGKALSGLCSYIDNLPGYNHSKPVAKQESVVGEQHGYITMQLVRTFNSLADTYGYIMKTPLAEIDFLDVFINRRILIVLLPALEKSPPELTNLGRIIVASIKSTMAVGLGADVEGDWRQVIDAKPTTAPSPYMCILDEYGYYAVEGFAVVPAQARSLGFSAIFAGQDLPAFKKASESEAKSTLANTTTKFCGKLECTETYDFFKSISGEGYYSKTSGFQNQAGTVLSSNYMDNQAANIEKLARVTYEDLSRQISGEWHMFFASNIIRINSFFSNPRKVKKLRTNHFIKCRPPSDEQARYFQHVRQELNNAANLADWKFPEVHGQSTSAFELMRIVETIAPAINSNATGFARGFHICKLLHGIHEEEAESFQAHVAKAIAGVNESEDFDDQVEMDAPDELFGVELSDDAQFEDFDADELDDVLFDNLEEPVMPGTLNPETVQSGLFEVEKRLGRKEDTSKMISDEITREMSKATQYPSIDLSQEPNLDDFIAISQSLRGSVQQKLKEQEEDD